MAKNTNPAKPATPKPAAPAAPGESAAVQNVGGFEVAGGDSNAADNQAAAQSPPPVTAPAVTPADAVAKQLDEKTARDAASQAMPETGRQEQEPQQAAVDPVAAAMREVDAMLDECKTHLDGHELRRKLEVIPAKTKLERRIKEAALQRVAEWTLAVQNGTQPPRIEANEIAKLPGLQTAGIQAERMELRSREDRDIKSLLAENEKLQQQLAEMQKKQAA